MSTVSYKIKGSHDNSAINQAKQGLLSLGEGVNNLNNLFKGFVGLKVVQQLGRAVNDTLKSYQNQQTAIAQLTNSIANNSKLTEGVLKRIVTFTGQLQAKGIFGDEELQRQASFLASMGLTEQQIKSVVEAAANLAAKGVMPLDSAVKNMAKTFGGMTGELGESIPALKSLTVEQLKAGEAIALIQRQYGGALETAAQTLAGRTQQATNLLGDIKEKIGAIFAVGKMTFLEAMIPVLDKINQWLEANLPRIINFFINLPEIAKVTLNTIWEMIKKVFTFDFWIAYFKSVAELGLQAFKSFFSILFSYLNAIKTTLWEPLRFGFEWLVYGIESLFTNLVNGLIQGIQGVINFLLSGVNKVIGLINKASEFLGKGSILEEVGSIQLSLATGPAKPKDSASDLGKTILAAWSGTGDTILGELKKVGTTYLESVGKIGEQFNPILQEAGGQFAEILNRELPPSIKKIVEPVVSSMQQELPKVLVDNPNTASDTTNQLLAALQQDRQLTQYLIEQNKENNRLGDNGVFSQIGQFFSDTFGSIVQSIGPFIKSISSVSAILNPLQTIFQGMMQVLSPIIDSLLKPLTGILIIIGRTLGMVLAPVLKMLEPVISLITKAFIFLYNYAIRPLANAIIWVISTIYNLVVKMVNAVLSALDRIPFVNISWRMEEMDYDSMKLEKIDGSDVLAAGESSTSGSSTSGQSASYSGSRDIVVNINIDRSAIAGDLRELALIIRNEIKAAEGLSW